MAVMLMMAFHPSDSDAQTPLERMVSPGKLSDAHADLEPECESCHLSFKKSAQRQLCLDCHEDVAQDFDRRQGFHGRGVLPADMECRACHTEHEGRRADIVGFEQDDFIHELTDFELIGGHRTAECADCHLPGKKWSEAPQACVSCHKDDDPHRGQLAETCANCHNSEDWTLVGFDHDTTDFPLLGQHAEAECMSCHKGQVWQELPADCASCHKADDIHEGRFGADCESCHEATGWTDVRFNHDITGFRLRGGHSKIECEACHTQGTTSGVKLGTACIDCHQDDDAHEGRNGTDCASCHSVNVWSDIRFDHSKTDFPLLGAHATTKCESCHVESVLVSVPSTECIACHVEGDVHEGILGADCETCHVSTAWTEVRFDHDIDTAFALEGEHETAECAACHVAPVHVALPDVGCVDCHASDDAHEGQLGTRCGDCHDATDWTSTVRFDHDFTDFPLLGKHEGVDCADCHQTTAFGDAESECVSCHRKDDEHNGRFGEACETCHNPSSWEHWKFDHTIQTDFPLTGKHADTGCYECHTERNQKSAEISDSCYSCHRKDDVHRGTFGRDCAACHNTSDFSAVELRR